MLSYLNDLLSHINVVSVKKFIKAVIIFGIKSEKERGNIEINKKKIKIKTKYLMYSVRNYHSWCEVQCLVLPSLSIK